MTVGDLKMNIDTSDLVKVYLDKLSYFAYKEYNQNKEKSLIIFEHIIGNNEGFIYSAKNASDYSVYIVVENDNEACLSEIMLYLCDLLKIVDVTITLTIFSENINILKYLHNSGFYDVYSSVSMMLKREEWIYQKDEIELIPYQVAHNTEYLDVLGDAFYPVREALDLVPYNWYQNNQKTATEGFMMSSEKGCLFGYFVEKELVGVLEIVENEIETIAVKVQHQGKGVGTILLNTAINMIFREDSNKEIFLSLLGGNQKALRLYERQNFQIVGKQTILKKISNK
ncbi:MAG: Acetyltransferase, GNAT family [Candidatus Uhrbacteria bacterium GW2011_GWF2_39_13]|uniref:Acetyltransferase, GNAT family n=1 Tax=Candidatus Uhrbacteria bacterium GW2011_GWF2_39_13 TaxID=1618995 RepID=A0A0G0MI44_9BACT|nr:MAG: Acetyltransferase, GNAT family [Candidatus Uhrbacteria bacterium GW2011_GWF2_39_13]